MCMYTARARAPHTARAPHARRVCARLRLQESLGGNAHCVMVACISAARDAYRESVGTLLFAQRARAVRNTVRRNEDPSQALLSALQEEVARLRQQLLGGGGGEAGSVAAGLQMQLLREKSQKVTALEDAAVRSLPPASQSTHLTSHLYLLPPASQSTHLTSHRLHPTSHIPPPTFAGRGVGAEGGSLAQVRGGAARQRPAAGRDAGGDCDAAGGTGA